MKKKSNFALLTIMIMLISILLSGCGDSLNNTSSTDKKQYINLAVLDDVQTLDSNKATDGASLNVIGGIMEGLGREINDGKKEFVEPAGAEKWEISADGLKWIFHLRDCNWSDGKKIIAQDYVYAWKRLLDPKTASEYAYLIYCVKGAEEFNSGKGSIDNVGVEAPDDKTFVVTLRSPTPYFEKLVGFKPLFPLRKDVVEGTGDKYGQDISNLIYNGPFTVDQWVKGSKVVLKKNTKYWDEKNVKMETVTWLVVKDDITKAQLFKNKQLDEVVLRGEYRDKFKALSDKGEIGLFMAYKPSVQYLAFNCKDSNKLFTNSKVRLAFSLSLDRESFSKNIYKRGYTPYGWVPYGLSNGAEEYRSKVAEPLKAIKDKDPKILFKEGLKELGLNPNGKYKVKYLCSSNDTFTRACAEWAQGQFKSKLGVDMQIQAVNSYADFNVKIKNGDYQISDNTWGADYNDPMTMFDMWTSNSGNNMARWSNAKYDELIKQVSVEADFNKRLALFKQMEQILLVDDCAIAPTLYYDSVHFTQKYLHGISFTLFGNPYEVKYSYTHGR